MAMSVISVSGRGLPCVAGYPGLLEESQQKGDANIATMGIGQNQATLFFEHKLMPPSHIRASESQCAQPTHEFTPRNRCQAGHSGHHTFFEADNCFSEYRNG